jgi:hypothetical protein
MEFAVRIGDVLDFMVCVVEGGTYEVAHACIDDSKLFGSSFLDIQHTCDERATLGDN